jgi:hypothetical protein
MRHTAIARAKLIAVAMFAALGGALASHSLWGREAIAQPMPSSSTIYVPSDGLVFRSFDGRPIARLTRDTHGGVLELYDEREEPTTRVSAGGTLGHLRASGPVPTPPSRVFTLDEEDPWLAPPPPAPAPRPGAGF